jgi:hypothetical protein
MRLSLRRASDWIYIRLADSQRSRASGVFENQIGSPVRMRTCDPFVHSLGVKCFGFSSNISLQAALRTSESSARERKTDAPAQGIRGVFLAYF